MATETTLKSKTVYVADKNIRKHRIEWWNKIVLSLACLVFFFIGAPLGAIIRKGGLGVSVFVSVLIFIIYYILDTSGAKQAREGVMTVWFGRWLSTFVLAPLGIWLTYKSNNDSTVFNKDLYLNALRWMIAKPEKRHIFCKEVVIDDPDYVSCMTSIDQLTNVCQVWLDNHSYRYLSYRSLFSFPIVSDTSLATIVERMDAMVNELGNSRDAVVLDHINHYPVFSSRDHLCPLPSVWLMRVVAIFFPIGIMLWLRASFFTHRRQANVRQIISINEELKKSFADRKLL